MSIVLDKPNKNRHLRLAHSAESRLHKDARDVDASQVRSLAATGTENAGESDEELIDRMDRLFLARVQLERALMREVAEGDRRNLYQRDGFESMEQ